MTKGRFNHVADEIQRRALKDMRLRPDNLNKMPIPWVRVCLFQIARRCAKREMGINI